MASTFEKIATTTLSSAAASVTFSSISGAYTDLFIVYNGSTTLTGEMRYRFNGDSGSNYSFTQLYNGGGGTAGSTRDSNRVWGRIGSGRTTQNVHTASINNYSNTTTYKTVLSREAAAGSDADQAFSGLWRSTAAITSIEFNSQNGNFNIGTVFTLYGIKAA